MSALARHLLISARANRLMNHRLHASCQRLSQEDFVAPRIGFFPSLRATLNHILIVDWYYVDALEQAGRGRAVFENEIPCATLPELVAEQARGDARLIRFCAGLKDPDLAREVGCDRGEQGWVYDRIDRTLAHLFMHQIHHRGQVHAMLSSTAIAPPQLDEFLMRGDARFRVQELAELGMTEADLAP